MSQEATRRKVSGDVFGAPLAKIAAAVEEHFGRKVSETGIHNLMPPPRTNSVHTTQRGEINCRIVRTVRGGKIPHERAAWASQLIKGLRQLMTLLSSRGVLCTEFSSDQSKKYPFWICATSGASPAGYMEVRADGLPGFCVLDHDTPVGPKMLLTISGVQERVVASDATSFDNEKPQYQVSSDGPMSVFLRPHRYLPTDAVTNARDFETAFKTTSKPDALKPDVVMLITDGGWDYSMHSMLNHHLVLRQALLSYLMVAGRDGGNVYLNSAGQVKRRVLTPPLGMLDSSFVRPRPCNTPKKFPNGPSGVTSVRLFQPRSRTRFSGARLEPSPGHPPSASLPPTIN